MRIRATTAGQLTVPDRNPVVRTRMYEAVGIAPHGLTTRFTYTVPTAKHAHVGSASIQLIREAAAAPVGYWRAQLNDASNIWLRVGSITNAVGDRVQGDVSPGAIHSPGESVQCQTQDASTGGTISYAVNVMMVEFDS
jgi:hypothetical protein